ncbi:MAG: transglycosylase domain-containing protein [Leptospiraceae bacterium]|nr:transglycosylase domain-containing protein [Leptospiraceae bacterium]
MKKFLFYFLLLISIFFSILLIIPLDGKINLKGPEKIDSEEGSTIQIFSTKKGSFTKWKPLKEFPEDFIQIILFSEDKYFYYHPGFNLFSIFQAGYSNWKNEKIISGASTITQQSARILYGNIFTNRYLNKIIEIILALKLELQWSKSEILEFYLNNIPLNYNIDGFPLLSEILFEKNLKFLVPEEMVALSILPRAHFPSRPVFAKRFLSTWNIFYKGKQVDINTLYEYIYSKKNIKFFNINSGLHLSNWLNKRTNSRVIKSTVSLNLNEKVRSILNHEIKYLNKHGASQSAAVVLKIHKGEENYLELVSHVGSLDFLSSVEGQVNGNSHIREAGSILKPFVYGLGIENNILNSNTIIEDSEFSVNSPWTEGSFIPRNYDLIYWGPLTVSEALCNSRNIPAIKAVQMIGINKFLNFLRKIEFFYLKENFTFYGPGIALGTGGTTLLDITRAYSGFLTDGEIYKIKLGQDENHNPVFMGNNMRIFSEETSSKIKFILNQKELRRRAFGKRNFLDFPFDVSSKSGTSKDYRDAWTIGFTDKYVVGVWVGDFKGKKMNFVSGAWGAGRAFHQIIRLFTPKNDSKFKYSNNLKEVSLCRKTGKLPNSSCPLYSDLMEINFKIEQCKEDHSDESKIFAKTKIISPVNGKVFIIDPYIAETYQKIKLEFYFNRDISKELKIFLNRKVIQIPENFYIYKKFKKGKHEILIKENEKIIDSSIFFIK